MRPVQRSVRKRGLACIWHRKVNEERGMKKGLDAYKLKLIALAFMVLDHIYSFLNYPLNTYFKTPYWPQWIPVITRFVSPLFLYLMVEGFYHTRSRKKYLIRLFVAAAIMECGNVLINFCFHNVDPDTGKYTFRKLIEGHNIFLTLAMLFAFIWCLENIKQRKQVFVSVILVFFTALPCLVLEGGFYLLPIAVVLWFFHGRKPLQCAGIAAWCLLLLIKALVSHYTGSTG
ncbi:MAG: hypothetical protein IKS85_08540, partial [Lachnospiraceae bacterium]|nr:hypothetical protein [Lachnospiraceae bacterium]